MKKPNENVKDALDDMSKELGAMLHYADKYSKMTDDCLAIKLRKYMGSMDIASEDFGVLFEVLERWYGGIQDDA